jgi:hypothetical protein
MTVDDPNASTGSPYPAHYFPPTPPGSLNPVAMAQLASDEKTEPRRRSAQPHPRWRTGAVILVTGVFLGSFAGVVQRVHRNRAEPPITLINAAEQPPPEEAELPPPAADPADDGLEISVVTSTPLVLVPPSAKAAAKAHARAKAPVARPASSPALAPKETKLAAKEPKPVASEPKIVPPKKAEAPSTASTRESERLLKDAMGATQKSL